MLSIKRIGHKDSVSDEYVRMLDSVNRYVCDRGCRSLGEFVSECLADIRRGGKAMASWYDNIFTDANFQRYVVKLCETMNISRDYAPGLDFDGDVVSVVRVG